MQLPKKVQISGKPYIVKKDESRWGGNCRTGTQKIVVGTARGQSSQRKFTHYVHEVLEAIALERRLRYESSDEEVLFAMNHKQFSDYAIDVATAFWPMIKR